MAHAKFDSWFASLLILFCFSIKGAYSITCYVCDNCLTVNQNSTTKDNCGACLKSGIPEMYIKRECIDSCNDIGTKVRINDLLSCCTISFCNDARKIKPFLTMTALIYGTWLVLTRP
ncbi:unnamed protein product [Heterobilharzia americana]|nr:unnamed protein product [Heterobilharzia americana]CAH8466702.1 unnamed protein product [Heterobilharzia americana]